MTKTIDGSGFSENPNASDSSVGQLPILTNESEAFGIRLREAKGDESIRSFARRCGFSNALIGAYLKGEKLPGMENLVAIAVAAGVTVDWLATGRPPKTRAELRAASLPLATGAENALKAALQLAEDKIAAGQLTPRLTAAARAAAPAWRKAASNNPALEERLESLLATLDFLQAADGE